MTQTGSSDAQSSGIASPLLISCVIPTYQNLELAGRAILSAVQQINVNHEVIVTDDSIGDDIRLFVEAIKPLYPRLKYIVGARNGNPVSNWNKGLKEATGKYAVMLHQDEFMADRLYLKKAVNWLEREQADGVVFGCAVVGISRSSNFKFVQAIRPILQKFRWTLLIWNWIGATGCVVFRRHDSLMFDENLTQIVDVDFYCRLFRNVRQVPVISSDIAVISIGHHRDQISNSIDSIHLSKLEMKNISSGKTYGITEYSLQIAKYVKQNMNKF
jgi:glycosyltransferase involved in cell wall biosynthesis